jgi:uncharacterized protein YndB with AHSA1/START domain
MSDAVLPHALERELPLPVRRDEVFRWLADSTRWESWWGAGSRIDPVPGGAVLVRYPNGVEAAGSVLACAPPERLVFTFGWASGEPVPPGASRVTVELAAAASGTLLRLRHELADAAVRDSLVQGWRYQLAQLANAVADAAFAGAAATVDAWFALWSEPDAARRAEILAAVVAPGVRFRDRWSSIESAADLAPHLAAVHRFAPGSRIERTGPARHCQGVVLADWRILRGEAEAARGTNVFTLDADGRIADAIGIWNA